MAVVEFVFDNRAGPRWPTFAKVARFDRLAPPSRQSRPIREFENGRRWRVVPTGGRSLHVDLLKPGPQRNGGHRFEIMKEVRRA